MAYETLSRRDRRTRHLAAAEHLGASEETVEVVAAHYVAAYESAPDADDASVIKAEACAALVRAAKHAAALSAAAEARRYFEQAAQLVDQPIERASLLTDAGEWAGRAAGVEAATPLLEGALSLFAAAGDVHGGARASLALGRFQFFSGYRDESLARLEHAFEVLADEGPSEDLADVAAMLSRAYWFSGDLEQSLARADFALDVAEAHRHVRALVHALRAKSACVFSRGHIEEGDALLKHGLELALEHGLAQDAATCYFILSDKCFRTDRYRDALDYLDRSLEQIHKLGSRPHEAAGLAERTYPLWMLGRWDEVIATETELDKEMLDAGGVVLSLLQSGVDIYLQRGQLDEANRLYHLFDRLEGSSDIQEQSTYAAVRATLFRAEGRLEEALAAGLAALDVAPVLGPSFQGVKHAIVEALEAALALGDHAKVEELYEFVNSIPLASTSPYMSVQAQRLRARTAGDPAGLLAAAQRFREGETPFWLAVTLLEHAELTGDQDSQAEALATFEQLRASRWVERATAGQRTEIVA